MSASDTRAGPSGSSSGSTTELPAGLPLILGIGVAALAIGLVYLVVVVLVPRCRAQAIEVAGATAAAAAAAAAAPTTLKDGDAKAPTLAAASLCGDGTAADVGGQLQAGVGTDLQREGALEGATETGTTRGPTSPTPGHPTTLSGAPTPAPDSENPVCPTDEALAAAVPAQTGSASSPAAAGGARPRHQVVEVLAESPTDSMFGTGPGGPQGAGAGTEPADAGLTPTTAAKRVEVIIDSDGEVPPGEPGAAPLTTARAPPRWSEVRGMKRLVACQK
jgi:hypothetical protein